MSYVNSWPVSIIRWGYTSINTSCWYSWLKRRYGNNYYYGLEYYLLIFTPIVNTTKRKQIKDNRTEIYFANLLSLGRGRGVGEGMGRGEEWEKYREREEWGREGRVRVRGLVIKDKTSCWGFCEKNDSAIWPSKIVDKSSRIPFPAFYVMVLFSFFFFCFLFLFCWESTRGFMFFLFFLLY